MIENNRITIVRFFISLLVLMSINSVCRAQGDYSLSLGKGYRFVRCNPVDTVVEDSSGRIVFSPMDYQGIGPITHYSFIDGTLVIQTAGREIRNSDFYEKPDFGKTYYFAILISSKASGPFSRTELEEQFSIQSIRELDWKRPRRMTPFVFGVGLFAIFAFAIVLASVIVMQQRRRPT